MMELESEFMEKKMCDIPVVARNGSYFLNWQQFVHSAVTSVHSVIYNNFCIWTWHQMDISNWHYHDMSNEQNRIY